MAGLFLVEEPLHDSLRGDFSVAAFSARNTFLPVHIDGHMRCKNTATYNGIEKFLPRDCPGLANIARDSDAVPAGCVVLLAQNPPLQVECDAKFLNCRNFEYVLQHTFLSSSRSQISCHPGS